MASSADAPQETKQWITPIAEKVSAQDIVSGYRHLIERAHTKGLRVIGTTIPPFENAFFAEPRLELYTPEREAVRREVNAWITSGAAFDAVVDFDTPVRDPSRPTQLLPEFDAGDHLHVKDAGYVATANVIPLSLFASGSAPAAQRPQHRPGCSGPHLPSLTLSIITDRWRST